MHFDTFAAFEGVGNSSETRAVAAIVLENNITVREKVLSLDHYWYDDDKVYVVVVVVVVVEREKKDRTLEYITNTIS